MRRFDPILLAISVVFLASGVVCAFIAATTMDRASVLWIGASSTGSICFGLVLLAELRERL